MTKTMKQDSKKCTDCDRTLEEGMDVLEVREGVLGLLGFVPIKDEHLFCSKVCLKNYLMLGGKGLPMSPKRQP